MNIRTAVMQYLQQNYSSNSLLFVPHWPHKIEASPVPHPAQTLLPSPKTQRASSSLTPLPKTENKPILPKPSSPSVPDKEHKKMADILRKTAPHIVIHDHLPPDNKAKQVKSSHIHTNAWPAIPILYTQELATHHTLLENIAKALTRYFHPSSLVDIAPIEKDNHWKELLTTPDLRWIFAPKSLIFRTPHLLQHLREHPASGCCYIYQTPLFLLPPLADIETAADKKKALWAEIQHHYHHVCNRHSR